VLGMLWVLLWVGLKSSGLYTVHERVQSSGPRVQGVSYEGSGASRWNRDLFATIAVYGLGAAPLAFGLYAAPLYLSRVLHVSQASLGHLLWIPPAGWETGYLVWGWIADRRRARGAGRPGGLFAAFSVAGFSILLAPLAARCAYPVTATMALFYLQMFLAGGFVVLSLSDGMNVQRKENSGFLAGAAISSWAGITGLLTPVLGRFFDRHDYVAGFWLVSWLPVAGTVLWQLLRIGPALSARDQDKDF